MEESAAFIAILRKLLGEIELKEMQDFFNDCIAGLEGKALTQESDPRHKSIIKFGFNLFPFTNEQYIEMAKLISGD